MRTVARRPWHSTLSATWSNNPGSRSAPVPFSTPVAAGGSLAPLCSLRGRVSLLLMDVSGRVGVDLEDVAPLTSLRELCVSKCELCDDAALAHCAGLARLTSFILSGGNEVKHLTWIVGPAGVRALGRLTCLERLELSRCAQFDSDSLAHLSGLVRLSRLGLAGTAIVNAAHPILDALPALRFVIVAHTRVS